MMAYRDELESARAGEAKALSEVEKLKEQIKVLTYITPKDTPNPNHPRFKSLLGVFSCWMGWHYGYQTYCDRCGRYNDPD